MTITREQVADLRPGDVVEFRIDDWPEGQAIRGAIEINEHGVLVVPIPGDHGCYWLRSPATGFAFDGDSRSLTVISRAPRPLYVNHDRAQPVAGDVVRDADSDRDPRTWVRNAEGFSHEWMTGRTHAYVPREDLPDRLRLLVDGETGQVVP